MSKDASDTHDTLWKLIKDTKFGMLTHRSESGALHAHPLTTQNRDIDEDARLYFFIPRDGEICKRLNADPKTCLAYANPSDDSYVSVSGTASLVEDMEKKRALWSAAAKAWFPDGVEDPNLALLAVHIDHAEYWDVTESKLTQLFKMATAAITGNPPNMGEHKKL